MTNEKQQLIKLLREYHDTCFTPGIYEHSIFGKAAMLLENGAIYCKDCRYSSEQRVVLRCNNPYGLARPAPDAFCAYAERKSN